MLNVKERKKELENKYELEEILYCFNDYSKGYICDIITEVCDNNVDVYNYDLWEWSKDNEYYIEQAINEFGIDSNNFDLMQLFRQGQYYYYQETCYNNLDDIIEYLILSNLDVEEINATVYDEILNISGQEDNNARIEDYIEEIEDLIEENNLKGVIKNVKW